MGQGKRAWIYCAIDAPEDRNGALKSQFKQLIDYGEQMGFELVGSSSDVGTTPLWNRNGFRHFIEAIQHQVAFFRVSEQYISWNIRRPVSTPFGIVRCPITTLWK